MTTEITPHLIPFWVQILKQAEDVEDAHLLLVDIGILLSGPPLYDDDCAEDLREIFEEQGRDYDEEIRLGPTYGRQTHDAANQYFDYFLSLINHPSEEFRKEATFVLIKFPEYAARIVPILIAHYALEPSETVRDSIVRSVRFLTQMNKDFPEQEQAKHNAFFLQIIQSDKQRGVGVRSEATGGFQAALALISKLGAVVPQEAVDVLVQAAIECQETERTDFNLEDACEGLAHIGAERGIPIFLSILRKGRSSGLNTIMAVVKPLLDLAFGEPDYEIKSEISFPLREITYRWFKTYSMDVEIEPVNKLSQQQSEVIRAVVETEKVWTTYKTDLFEWYGLPATREKLKALL